MTTREQIIAAAKEAGITYSGTMPEIFDSQDVLAKFYAIAFEAGRVAEREACAALCDEIAEADNGYWCAMTIRARGDTK